MSVQVDASLDSPSRILQRSKSHGSRIEVDKTGASSDCTTDSPKKKDSNEPKIIVTSFAPNPRAKQQPQAVAVRTTAYLYNSRINLRDREEEEEPASSKKNNLAWPDGKSQPPVILFHPKVLRKNFWECKKIGGLFS